MIEINLLEKKSTFKAPVVLGVDLGTLPWKSLVISYLLATYPVTFLQEQLAEKKKVKDI
jgi:hypothetical protein